VPIVTRTGTFGFKAYAMPLYGSASNGDMVARAARAMVNREVQAHFGGGECGPLKVTSEDLDNVTCPVLILTGQDDPMAPAAAAQRVASSVQQAVVDLHVFAGVGHGGFRQAPTEAFARLRAFVSALPVPRAETDAASPGKARQTTSVSMVAGAGQIPADRTVGRDGRPAVP
jgi:pimeloyl-ACP methyl ester carboxylesterase